MPDRSESESRKLLRRLRDTLAVPAKGQVRLDQIVRLIADSMRTEVCSIYLFRDAETLELCATEGLRRESAMEAAGQLGEKASGANFHGRAEPARFSGAGMSLVGEG